MMSAWEGSCRGATSHRRLHVLMQPRSAKLASASSGASRLVSGAREFRKKNAIKSWQRSTTQ